MKTKFLSASISTGEPNSPEFQSKYYQKLSDFRDGLKAHNCPFEVNQDGLFYSSDNPKFPLMDSEANQDAFVDPNFKP